ncbi:MAG: hypothetical protein GY740_24395 [Gammaproteobacteria bacterium]|nr:hypothetical protein [Gammaproteobacteria bacterium]
MSSRKMCQTLLSKIHTSILMQGGSFANVKMFPDEAWKKLVGLGWDHASDTTGVCVQQMNESEFAQKISEIVVEVSYINLDARRFIRKRQNVLR